MNGTLINEDRLIFLIKPLYLFLEHDVQADEQTKALIKEEWDRLGCYYVAELLASTESLSFINVHIALKKMDFTPSQLSSIRHLLPRSSSENYDFMKPKICNILGMNAALWTTQSPDSLIEDHDLNGKQGLFNIHFKETDLEAEGIDIEQAEQLFHDEKFLSDFSDLIRSHALRLYGTTTSNRRSD